MKFLMTFILFSTLAQAVTAPESISSEEIEVGTPKDCVGLGKSDDQSEDVDKLALQKQVMDCLGPEEDLPPVEIQTKNEVVTQ